MTLTAAVLTLTLTTGGTLLPFADEVQQVRVDGTPTVDIYVVTKQVRISGHASRAKGWKPRGLCPKAHADGADLVLDCTTPRLHTRISGSELTIYRLRGTPWIAKDEPLPRVAFLDAGLTGPALAAEIALRDGHIAQAREQLNKALETSQKDYAALRLADLALDDDVPTAALDWLNQASHSGAWSRLAEIRLCELTGNCMSRAALFDTSGLPGSMRRDIKLRALHLLRFDSTAAAMNALADAGAWPEGLCEDAPLCFNVLHDALASDDLETRAVALSIYASGPVWGANPRRPWLAQAAADAAVALGAPLYAAGSLAAATPDVPRAQLGAHLKRVVQLYLDAKEPARAAAVLAYAQDTLGKDFKRDATWKRLHSGSPPAGVATAPFASDDAELAKELAVATLARSRAQETR